MQKIDLQLTVPNQLTLLRIFLAPVFAYLILSESPLNRQLSLAVFVVAALTDWYDGWIARKMGYTSRWGKFLDPLADKILTSVALLVFAGLDLVDAWMVWIVIVRDFFITGLRILAEYKDKPVVTSKGAQAKTFGVFVVIYYILILYVARSVPFIAAEWGGAIDTLMSREVLFGMMLVVTLSSVGTAIAYVFDNRKLLVELYDSFRPGRRQD